MKKRISTKLYNTDTADLVCEKDGVILYQKKAKGRELFIVDEHGIKPVSTEQALAVFPDAKISQRVNGAVGTFGYHVRVSKDTYEKLLKVANDKNISIANVIAMLSEKL